MQIIFGTVGPLISVFDRDTAGVWLRSDGAISGDSEAAKGRVQQSLSPVAECSRARRSQNGTADGA
jgi:hypothetical protein